MPHTVKWEEGEGEHGERRRKKTKGKVESIGSGGRSVSNVKRNGSRNGGVQERI